MFTCKNMKNNLKNIRRALETAIHQKSENIDFDQVAYKHIDLSKYHL